MTKAECYNLFKDANPTIQIGKCVFNNHRRPNVCHVHLHLSCKVQSFAVHKV